MIRTHTTKHGGGTLQSLVPEVQGDGKSEIRNGYPVNPYMPGDPGRRVRLLRLLAGITEEGDAVTTEEGGK